MVGAGRFELPTPGPPDRCANRAALRSDVGNQGLAAYTNKHKSGIAHRLPTALSDQLTFAPRYAPTLVLIAMMFGCNVLDMTCMTALTLLSI